MLRYFISMCLKISRHINHMDTNQEGLRTSRVVEVGVVDGRAIVSSPRLSRLRGGEVLFYIQLRVK